MDRNDAVRVIAVNGAAFAAIRENQETIRKLSEQFKPIQEGIKASGVVEAAARSLKAFESDKMRAVISAASLQQGRFAAALEAAGGARSVAKMLESQKGLLDSLARMQSPALARALKDLSAIGASSFALSVATSDALSTLGKQGLSELQVARLVEPLAYQTRFLGSVSRRTTAATAKEAAYSAALRASNAQVTAFSNQIVELVPAPVVDDGIADIRPYNIAREITNSYTHEAALHVPGDADFGTLPERIAAKTRKILKLVTECNEAAKLGDSEEVFKPTTRVIAACVDAPFIIADSVHTLGSFVDCLHFVLYEGAGDDKLRFLSEAGGPLERDECDAIWAVKALRNKWLRHDADHGSDSKIRKSWADLGEHLHRLGVRGLPTNRDHFIRIQIGLLGELEAFLTTLLARLNGEIQH